MSNFYSNLYDSERFHLTLAREVWSPIQMMTNFVHDTPQNQATISTAEDRVSANLETQESG